MGRKIILASILSLLTLFESVFGQDEGIRYLDAIDLFIGGKSLESISPYHRADVTAYPFTQKEALRLKFPAGVFIAFSTDSPMIKVFAEFGDISKVDVTTPIIAKSGFDLYIRKNGKWISAGSKALVSDLKGSVTICEGMSSEMKDCLLYLPLMTEVVSMKVGVSETSVIKRLENPFYGKIVLCGSSVFQGVGASRSGMNVASQMSRKSGLNFENYSLPSLCRMQPHLSKMLSDIKDVDAFVFDCFNNPTEKEIEDNFETFVAIIRKAYPVTPLIFCSAHKREKSNFDERYAAGELKRYSLAKRKVIELMRSDKNVYFIDMWDASGNDSMGHIDGVHPDGLGYFRWSEYLLPKLQEIFYSSCPKLIEKINQDGRRGLRIEWSEPHFVVNGGYARVHRLNDGRLMMAFASGSNGNICFSEDNGSTWTPKRAVFFDNHFVERGGVNVSNSEFTQLNNNNPCHPGRIIYAANLRPKGNRSSVIPYSIAIIVSDDGGKNWSSSRVIHSSKTWSEDVVKGCYEPFVLELPDGTVQVYFADETPYYSEGKDFQNISVIESNDGGDTWGKARIVSYTEGYRDGMPAGTVVGDKVYIAIEAIGDSARFHPEVVSSSVFNSWSDIVYGDSEYRFNPLQVHLDSKNIYAGAPYLIQTDNYLVLSYQSSEGGSEPNTKHSTMEVQVCPKCEIRNGKFVSMRAKTRPLTRLDQSKEKALWNALCDIGNDEILAVSQWNSSIFVTRGKICQE